MTTFLRVLGAAGLIVLAAILILILSGYYICKMTGAKAVGLLALLTFPPLWIAFLVTSGGIVWLFSRR